ncbi:MAG: signal peptidase II [Candidatus Uhrbacteria bacterium]|nr:signal peptidase II [Candidatus Uhrbacteria bacterium]
MRRFWLTCVSFAIIGIIFFLDQFTKTIMFASDHAPSFSFFGGWIKSVQHRNAGIIANIALPSSLILSISLMVILLLVIGIILSIRQSHQFSLIIASLILGGALGNTFDRLILSYVRDWLLLFNRSAINLADVSIVIGILLYFLYTAKKTAN